MSRIQGNHRSMTYEIDWALVVEIVKAIPPVVVAAIVGWIAYQQWVTAKDKLALDLFDRRFAAHKALVSSINAWRNEKYRQSENVIFQPPSEHATQLNREIAEARFLFGDDVRDQLKVIVKLLQDLESAKGAVHRLAADAPDDDATQETLGRVLIGLAASNDAVKEFDHRVERYMMLDRISVAKPKPRLEEDKAPGLAATLAAVREQRKAEGPHPVADD